MKEIASERKSKSRKNKLEIYRECKFFERVDRLEDKPWI
jgi:hypothetical protein